MTKTLQTAPIICWADNSRVLRDAPNVFGNKPHEIIMSVGAFDSLATSHNLQPVTIYENGDCRVFVQDKAGFLTRVQLVVDGDAMRAGDCAAAIGAAAGSDLWMKGARYLMLLDGQSDPFED